MVGLLEDHRLRVPSAFPRGGLAIHLLGETFPELGGSEFAEAVLGATGGRPPALDLDRERALLDLLHAAAGETLLRSAHDCGDGGLAVALAESAIGEGHGFAVTLTGDLPGHLALFSESASRAVVSVDPADEERLVALAAEHGVPCTRLGETGGPRAMVDGSLDVAVADLADTWELAIPRLLGEAG
jgi:phosphoribosylformylglycinamidine synthase subunit PurL